MTPEATAPDHDALIVYACRSVRTDLLAHEVIRDQPMLKDILTSNYDTLTLLQETTVSPVTTVAPDDYGRRLIKARQGECSRRDTLYVIMRPHLTPLNFTILTLTTVGVQSQHGDKRMGRRTIADTVAIRYLSTTVVVVSGLWSLDHVLYCYTLQSMVRESHTSHPDSQSFGVNNKPFPSATKASLLTRVNDARATSTTGQVLASRTAGQAPSSMKGKAQPDATAESGDSTARQCESELRLNLQLALHVRAYLLSLMLSSCATGAHR